VTLRSLAPQLRIRSVPNGAILFRSAHIRASADNFDREFSANRKKNKIVLRTFLHTFVK
jgi:hypothetical protein